MNRVFKCFILCLTTLVLILSCFCTQNNILKAESDLLLNKVFENITASNISSIATYDNINFTYVQEEENTIYKQNKDVVQEFCYNEVTNNQYISTAIAVSTEDTTYIFNETAQKTIQGTAKPNQNLYTSKDFTTKTQHKLVYTTDPNDPNPSYDITYISSMCYDFYNKVYMLEQNQKYILTFNTENEKLERYINLNAIEIDENSKICATTNGKTIYVLSNQNIYKISQDNISLYLTNASFANIENFACDCSGALYYNLSTEPQNLYKITRKKVTEITNLSVDIEELFLEQKEGRLYILNNNNIYEFVKQGYIQNLTDCTPPMEFNKQEILNSQASIAKTNKNCDVLISPYALVPSAVASKDSKVIVLSTYVDEDENLYYCMFENAELDNGFILGFVHKNNLNIETIPTAELQKRVFITTRVFKYPTQKSAVVEHIAENTVASIVSEVNDYTDAEQNQFYCVKFTNNGTTCYGYINRQLTMEAGVPEIEMIEGEYSGDTYSKFIEYIIIMCGITFIEVIVICFIVKKTSKKKNIE